MAIFSCFSSIFSRRKKPKGYKLRSKAVDFDKALRIVQAKAEASSKPVATNDLTCSSFELPRGNHNPMCTSKVMNHESPVRFESTEAAYDGEDEYEENSVRRNISDFDLRAQEDNSGNNKMDPFLSSEAQVIGHFKLQSEDDTLKRFDRMQSGHVSDPGIGKSEIQASPKLKRSCSNLETSSLLKNIADQFPLSTSQSFEELQELTARVRRVVGPGSPCSVATHCSADRVMLKKHSSSQVLPSRSRRLWWKLFLWSHRNLQKPRAMSQRPRSMSVMQNQEGGYMSDTIEPGSATESSKIQSPRSAEDCLIKDCSDPGNNDRNWDSSPNRITGLWPQNQWVAFPRSSSLVRVDEWVKDLEALPPSLVDHNEEDDEHIIFPPSPEKSPARSTAYANRRLDINLSEELSHANNVIRSLNSSSSVAHISDIGLKVIPIMSHFSSLRSVNLSGNFIVNIIPGSLPKGLHTLNLSRNKITTIEGLRELARLRVLDLSYNRISRIGQGLSNCTLIKELYLAGNKISDVEGLHRLLKLTVLDLSFNKITTTKALGQLVANYNSLLALNLLGNPIQNNISDDQLRKAACGLLPKLVYLNKQTIKPQRARDVLTDRVAKAALGNSSTSSRRKASKRIKHTSSQTSSGRRSSVVASQKDKQRLRNRTHQQLP